MGPVPPAVRLLRLLGLVLLLWALVGMAWVRFPDRYPPVVTLASASVALALLTAGRPWGLVARTMTVLLPFVPYVIGPVADLGGGTAASLFPTIYGVLLLHLINRSRDRRVRSEAPYLPYAD